MEENIKKQPEEEEIEGEVPFREYANNVYFDPSVWDISISFGQLGLRLPNTKRGDMEWKTAVTVPWPQAKLAAYYLLVNLMFHQLDYGSIAIPNNMIPRVLGAPDNADDSVKAVYKEIEHLHRVVFGPQSE